MSDSRITLTLDDFSAEELQQMADAVRSAGTVPRLAPTAVVNLGLRDYPLLPGSEELGGSMSQELTTMPVHSFDRESDQRLSLPVNTLRFSPTGVPNTFTFDRYANQAPPARSHNQSLPAYNVPSGQLPQLSATTRQGPASSLTREIQIQAGMDYRTNYGWTCGKGIFFSQQWSLDPLTHADPNVRYCTIIAVSEILENPCFLGTQLSYHPLQTLRPLKSKQDEKSFPSTLVDYLKNNVSEESHSEVTLSNILAQPGKPLLDCRPGQTAFAVFTVPEGSWKPDTEP